MRNGERKLSNLADRLWPLLLAIVAGLVLAVGIRGFRAEQPSAFRLNPFSTAPTTPLVTEAPPAAVEEIPLADGSTLVLRPGTVAFDLARFLNGSDSPPQKFAPSGITLPLDDDDAGSQQALRSLAVVLRAWPSASIEFQGNAGEAEQLAAALLGAGVDAGRMRIEADAPAAAPAAGRATLLQPPLLDEDAAPLSLVLTSR